MRANVCKIVQIYDQIWRAILAHKLCFPKPNSWSSDFIRTDVFLKGEARHSDTLIDMFKHPDFRLEDMQSSIIVHLLRRLELPFQATAVVTYNLWKEGDGDEKFEMVMRDYLEVFREIMRDPAGSTILTLYFVPFLMTSAIV